MTSSATQSYEQYIRHNRFYKLSFSVENISRFHKLKRELSVQVLETHARKLRLEKQYRAVLSKFRFIKDRETQNIFELEVDEILSEKNGQLSILKVLNSFSSRPFSFTVLVGGERSTDPFFRFLDSLGRNAKML